MSKKSDSLSNRVINISPVVYVNSHKKYNEDLDQLDSITITIKSKEITIIKIKTQYFLRHLQHLKILIVFS